MFYTYIKELSDYHKKMFTQEKPGSRYNLFYQAHPHLAIEKFYDIMPEGIRIAAGLLEIVTGAPKPDAPDDFKRDIQEKIKAYEPFKLYDFQIQATIDALYCKRLLIRAATGSGKSAIIGMLAKILYLQGKRGMILVPNISLVEQFSADLDNYNLQIPYTLIGGKNKGSLDSPLTISTWQSRYRDKQPLKDIDYLIIDEAHQAKAKEIFDIAKSCVNAEYIIGLTGTIPQNQYDFLKIVSVFGIPKSYISPRQLIDAGLGTKIKIYLHNYNNPELNFLDYQKALSYIIKEPQRNAYIAKLAKSLNGNTIILTSRNEHAYRLFKMLMPCETDEKSYKDLALQNHYNIFFINGNIDGNQRELIRNILETRNNAILVSNYSVLSTGVNIKNLHNLIFASPMKSYILITQSLGRLIRLHESKTEVQVHDICDSIGFFVKQKLDRIRDCYKPQNYEICECRES